ncbi:hypothetical protein [Mucilaginibacter sp. NFX135]|uniref:hypothetical protein n=1 Tax=Mucilaginibacter sp. NFX135 TaxID=3402687 RepID=UPI003AFAE434
MYKRLIFILLMLMAFSEAFSQSNIYTSFYRKFEAVANKETSYKQFYTRIDSIVKTREPGNSSIKIEFDRDVDFGYTQQRINITLNGQYSYHLSLLSQHDTLCFASILYGYAPFLSDEENKYNKRTNHPKIDTLQAIKYLKLRNAFYGSTKTIDDLKNELNTAEVYALFCGEAADKTNEYKNIEQLVKQKRINELRSMLVSISCERQAYGVLGFRMLKKAGTKITDKDKKILTYLNNRKSALLECRGCFLSVVNDIK